MKPSVILYKALPDDLQKRLEEHFAVTQVKNLSPETVAQHAGAFARAEGLLGSSEKVDVALLEKCRSFVLPQPFPWVTTILTWTPSTRATFC